MGSEAYLIRHDNKSMFDIGAHFGPGSLVDVFVNPHHDPGDVGITLPSVEQLASRLAQCMEHGDWQLEEGESFENYARQVAERIIRFADGRPVDCCHEEIAWRTGYTTTDTRYTMSWPYYDVFRTLPQRLRVSIQRGRLNNRYDYAYYLRLSEVEQQQFLAELPYAGKPPLVALAEAAPRKKPKSRR